MVINFKLTPLIFLGVFLSCQRSVDISIPVGNLTADYDGTITVTINQSTSETIGTCSFTGASDPAYLHELEYKITFSSSIDPTTFTTSDITNSGTGGGTTLNWSLENCGDDSTFRLTATNIVGNGTIIPSISSGLLENLSGTTNAASTSTDNSISFVKGWYQEAYIKAANSDSNDYFGQAVSIDGDTLAVGADQESSNQTTITNGTTASGDNSNSNSGAVYIYKRAGSSWTQEAYVKSVNTNLNHKFGGNVSLNNDTLVVGATGERSNQTTITNGPTADAYNFHSLSGAVYVYKRTGVNWAQQAYIKSSNNDTFDLFGTSISIHADTLAVGASGEDSNLTTITNGAGSSANDSNSASGAVYIYKRTGNNWAQQAYIKASNSEADDAFGIKVSLQNDTLSVAGVNEDSNQTTITNGTTSSGDNSNAESGAVYIYKRSGNNWAQEAFIKASNNESNDRFGSSISINNDLLAVGATGEDSNQTTITNGTTGSGNNGLADSGAVYIYKRTGSTWAQEAYIKASNTSANDWFGESISINGNTLAVGVSNEDSNQTTITNGATGSGNNSNADSGAVYIYKRTGPTWEQEAYIKASNNDTDDNFGGAISLNGDTLAVGATQEDSNQTTITSGETSSGNDASSGSGAVYVYRNRSRLFEIHDLSSSVTSSSVTLNWSKTGGSSTGYFVAYQAGATAPATCLLGTSINVMDVDTHTETPLSAATTYSFRVCATDGTSYTEGATVTVTTLP